MAGDGITVGDGEASTMSDAQASQEMPRYRCHKEVWALKIVSVEPDYLKRGPNEETDGSALLTFEDVNYAPIRVTADYVRRHNPRVGGYYVVYKDGYASWSPAKAFEEGYTRV